MFPPDHGPQSAAPADVARYIGEMAGALASLAGGQHMPMLTYFLNMARVEAEMQALEASERGLSPPRKRTRTFS